MDWFYVQNGSQIGPVPAAQFDDLVRSGQIRPDTLVWREGLVSWQPLGLITATPSPVPSLATPPPPTGVPRVIPGDLTNCVECGYAFAKSEMIAYGDAWICARCKPIFFQRVREGAPLASTGPNAWRSGTSLVTVSGSALPLRCAKCAGPVTGRPIARTLYWHPPWIYLIVLVSLPWISALVVGLPLYVIVALFVRKKARLDIPLCERHRRTRYVAILVSCLLAVLGLVGFVGAIVPGGGLFGTLGGLVAVVFVGLSIALVLMKGTLVSANKIDGDYVWVSGFSQEYLESLPEFPDSR